MNAAMRACWVPSRQTCARTGCVVCNGGIKLARREESLRRILTPVDGDQEAGVEDPRP